MRCTGPGSHRALSACWLFPFLFSRRAEVLADWCLGLGSKPILNFESHEYSHYFDRGNDSTYRSIRESRRGSLRAINHVYFPFCVSWTSATLFFKKYCRSQSTKRKIRSASGFGASEDHLRDGFFRFFQVVSSIVKFKHKRGAVEIGVRGRCPLSGVVPEWCGMAFPGLSAQ